MTQTSLKIPLLSKEELEAVAIVEARSTGIKNVSTIRQTDLYQV
jgi:hypothetical protein